MRKSGQKSRRQDINYGPYIMSKLTHKNDTEKYAPEGAYWNLTTSADHPGYVKSNIYTKGELYIEDAGLRNEVYEQLREKDAFSDVQIIGNEKVEYTWRD